MPAWPPTASRASARSRVAGRRSRRSGRRSGRTRVADVALIAHVGYDVEAIVPFLDAMEAAARRLCLAVLMEESPASVAAPFWPLVHGEARVPLPALPQLVELLAARGSRPRVAHVTGERRRWADRDELSRSCAGSCGPLPAARRTRGSWRRSEAMAAVAADGSVSVPEAPALEHRDRQLGGCRISLTRRRRRADTPPSAAPDPRAGLPASRSPARSPIQPGPVHVVRGSAPSASEG